jgi:hypothetical protein
LRFKICEEDGLSEVHIPIEKTGDYTIKITLDEVAGSTSYNRMMGTTSRFLCKKSEKGVAYFEEIGSNLYGKLLFQKL